MRVNFPIAFASLLLSIMLWFVVYAQSTPEPDTRSAPLTLDGLDDSKFFVNKAPSDVRLLLSVPADRVKDLGEERVTASVDLTQPVIGVHEYPVTVSPDWVRRYLADPRPTARITLEPVEDRTVRVNSLVKGALRDPNLRIMDGHLSPTTATVRGPKSEVETVDDIRAYVDLSAIDPVHPDLLQAELVPLDHRGTRPQHVRTSPTMGIYNYKLAASEATKIASVVPDLDVTYASTVLPDGYRLQPQTVTLSGRPAILANVSKVPTEIVRIRDLAHQRTVRARLLPPKGTAVVGDASVDVIIRVRPAPTPTTEKVDVPTIP